MILEIVNEGIMEPMDPPNSACCRVLTGTWIF
jgi:hypothetical protein